MSAIVEFFGQIGDSLEELNRKVYGVVTGRVINVTDPMSLGRVQVQLPFIDALDLSPWARVAVPDAGFSHGFYFIPNIGDEVLVAFEQGDVNVPYVIGSLWTAMSRPPLASPLPQIRAQRTLVGNQIVFTETPPSITIQTGPTPAESLPTTPSPNGPHHSIALSTAGIQAMTPTSITLQVGTTSLIISQSSITMQVGSSVVTMTSAGVDVTGTNVNITGGSAMALTGGVVRINS